MMYDTILLFFKARHVEYNYRGTGKILSHAEFISASTTAAIDPKASLG